MCAGDGRWQLPHELVVCNRKNKENPVLNIVCVICFLCCGIYVNRLFCPVFLLTIKQNLSASLFSFQRWRRILVRWCQKASGDFALSAGAL